MSDGGSAIGNPSVDTSSSGRGDGRRASAAGSHASGTPGVSGEEPHAAARPAALLGRTWFWGLLVAALFASGVATLLHARSAPPPPVLAQLPEFSLTNELGQPYGSRELRGKVWVADFIFTHCPSRCPMLTAEMAKLQKRTAELGETATLISFSVDPGRDTPEVLKAYGEQHHADARRWHFLTGSLDQVQDAVVAGFKMPMDPAPAPEGGSAAALFDIAHGTRFVLVDQSGRIRGYYETDPENMDRLVADLNALLRAPAL